MHQFLHSIILYSVIFFTNQEMSEHKSAQTGNAIFSDKQQVVLMSVSLRDVVLLMY